MRVIILAALCLSMVLFVAANNLDVGKREDGDYHVVSRRLLRYPVPGKPMMAKTGFHSKGLITAVTAVNAPGSNANVLILSGGPGLHHVAVAASSPAGAGLDVQVDIYATRRGREESVELD